MAQIHTTQSLPVSLALTFSLYCANHYNEQSVLYKLQKSKEKGDISSYNKQIVLFNEKTRGFRDFQTVTYELYSHYKFLIKNN
jgi:hypothetical protein